ncbi:hypothetical protein D3C86_1500380 [compost metagenome]
MLTSLKVVNIAVSFLTATKRFATVLRSGDIFSRRSFLDPATGAATVAFGASAFAAGCAAFCAFRASSFVILPSTPVPLTAAASTPFSASILPAEGDGVPVA